MLRQKNNKYGIFAHMYIFSVVFTLNYMIHPHKKNE